MSLELAPQTENRLYEYAAAEGVSIDDYVNRLLAQAAPPRRVPADDPVLQFLNAQIAEAENATPEQIAEADAEWQGFRRCMNANRQANGERLLYPEVAP